MNGLIAFFDILGYQSFLENNSAPENSASETAEKVLAIITDLPKQTKLEVLDREKSLHEKIPIIPSKQVANAVRHLIFSDTIVLSIKFPPNPSEVWKKTAFNYLINISGVLCHAMFKEGLPLRGAITRGDFLRKGNCFAGKAIVDAYKLCNALNLSSVVIDPSLNDELKIVFSGWPLDLFSVLYLTPQNKLPEKRMYHVNWLQYISEEKQNLVKSDIEMFVHSSFWKHNKDIPLEVDAKTANTIKFVRRLAIHLDEQKLRFKTGK